MWFRTQKTGLGARAQNSCCVYAFPWLRTWPSGLISLNFVFFCVKCKQLDFPHSTVEGENEIKTRGMKGTLKSKEGVLDQLEVL